MGVRKFNGAASNQTDMAETPVPTLARNCFVSPVDSREPVESRMSHECNDLQEIQVPVQIEETLAGSYVRDVGAFGTAGVAKVARANRHSPCGRRGDARQASGAKRNTSPRCKTDTWLPILQWDASAVSIPSSRVVPSGSRTVATEL